MIELRLLMLMERVRLSSTSLQVCPQGSLLSPHLFNIFINDFPKLKNAELAIYADDTAIFCDAPWKDAKKITKTLTTALGEASRFFHGWKIRLNTSKTEFITFTKSPTMIRRLNDSPPSVDNTQFEWSKAVTYLGVKLDQKLLFGQHIDQQVQKARTIVRSLFCLLKKNNSVSSYNKVAIYRSIVRPVMTYACQIFNNCAKCHLEKIQVQQNKVLRMALNAEWYTRTVDLHAEARIPFIRDFIDKLTLNFYERAKHHDNNLIKNLGKYTKDSIGFRVKHKLPKII